MTERDAIAQASFAGRHTGLDLLRALAIVLTFFVHFLWVIGGWWYRRDFEMLAIRDAKSFGEAFLIWLYHSQHGVFLFFVLSGYLMGRKWFGGRPVSATAFLRDRAWRTLPGAWAAVAVALALLATSGKLPSDPVLRFLENAFFLNWFRYDDSRALLVVTWSLQAEWLFYLSLPVVASVTMRYFKHSPEIAVAAIGLTICVALKFVSLRGAAYALFFIAGVIAAIKESDWRAHIEKTPWWFVLSIYTLVNLVYAWLSPTAARVQQNFWNPFDTHAIFFSITATVLLLKVAQTQFSDSAWVRGGRYIGRISYSIYLWHLLVILVVGDWFKWPLALDEFGRFASFAIYTCTVIAATWMVSALSFALIEQPYFNRRRAQSPVKSSEIKI
jgi:exopolysaccharide production protein ExoZ